MKEGADDIRQWLKEDGCEYEDIGTTEDEMNRLKRLSHEKHAKEKFDFLLSLAQSETEKEHKTLQATIRGYLEHTRELGLDGSSKVEDLKPQLYRNQINAWRRKFYEEVEKLQQLGFKGLRILELENQVKNFHSYAKELGEELLLREVTNMKDVHR